MKNKEVVYDGYIEGYYGRLFNWNDRHRIIDKLNSNKMNFYFYAPKEDDKHRLNWKHEYNNDWKSNFLKFLKYSKLKNVNLIVGISPGLDFNFKEFSNWHINSLTTKDLDILIKKISFFINIGVDNIALLFDDLPNNFCENFGHNISEGETHAQLINSISNHFKKPIFCVPRIYANELIYESKNYLIDFGNTINKQNITFFCGEYIVSKIFDTKSIKKIQNIIKTKIIIWDNYYSNDYCPRRLFVGPLTGRKNIVNIMTNPTGLIETDLLILDVVTLTKNSNSPKIEWTKILKNYGVPIEFFKISNFFLKPDFSDSSKFTTFQVDEKIFEYLDCLLWKWKSPLSREWYPYILGLKHDLQILQNKFTKERIIKTQTKLLAEYIINKKGEV